MFDDLHVGRYAVIEGCLRIGKLNERNQIYVEAISIKMRQGINDKTLYAADNKIVGGDNEFDFFCPVRNSRPRRFFGRASAGVISNGVHTFTS